MKRKKSLKRMCLASAGLLTASATSAFTESTIISAQNKTESSVLETTEQTEEVVLSTEVTTDYENFEDSSVPVLEVTTETTESPDIEISSDSTDESVETSETQESTESSTTEESSSTESSTSEPETEESSTTDTTSTDTSSTESSATDSSTSSSSESTDTSSSSTQPSKPKPVKPNKPTPVKPGPPANSNKPSTSTGGNSSTVVGPTQSTPVYNQTNETATGGISTDVFYIPRNLTTQAFIDEVGEDARKIAGENNLYASVMIAQAILESGSGNSALASAPNYNLFGIKGSYEGASVNFLTQEDTGGGQMISIRASFRKYPSYKESLTDYMKLLNGGVNGNNSFYSGTWKSNTKEYKDATRFLTGRYATDTSYASKLNSLIEAYNLTQYDELKSETVTFASLNKSVTKKSSKTNLKKENKEIEEKLDILYHVVKKGESLKSISELYNIPISAILERNQFERRMIFVGQKLVIPTTEVEEETTVVQKEEVVDRSIRSVQRVIKSIQGEQTNSKSYKLTASKKKSSNVYEVRSGDTLSKISKKTGVSVLSLKEWNSLDQYFLTEGQELVLTPPYATSI